MVPELDLGSTDFEAGAVSPFHESGACVALWSDQETTFKSLSERSARYPGRVPSDLTAVRLEEFRRPRYESTSSGSRPQRSKSWRVVSRHSRRTCRTGPSSQ